MKKISYAVILSLLIAVAPQVKAEAVATDILIKASQPAVYYYAHDGKRYVFPDEKTYKTWFNDFSNVVVVSDEFLASVPIGGNVTYRSGVKMVKITTDPKVYHVSGGGVLRWVKTEDLAKTLYGDNWNKEINDVPDAFFTNYNVGAEINLASDLSVSSEVVNYTTINSDKDIAQSGNPLYSNVEVRVIAVENPAQEPVAQAYNWVAPKIANADPYFHKYLKTSTLKNDFIFSWSDDRNGQDEVYFNRVDINGNIIYSAKRVTSNIQTSNHAVVSYDGGNNFYLFWEDDTLLKRAIFHKFYDLSNNPSAERVFASTTFSTSKNPAVTWNSTNNEYGVAWWDTRSSLSGNIGDLYFGRMTTGGLKIGDQTAIAGSRAVEFSPQIISYGSDYVMLWQDPSTYQVKSAKMDKNGNLINSVNLLKTLTGASNVKFVGGLSEIGAVWQDGVAGSKNIYFTALDSDGKIKTGPIALTLGDGDAISADITYINGSGEYAIVYQNNKTDGGRTILDIYFMKVKPDGSVSEPSSNVSQSEAESTAPVVTNLGNNLMVFWTDATTTGDVVMLNVR